MSTLDRNVESNHRYYSGLYTVGLLIIGLAAVISNQLFTNAINTQERSSILLNISGKQSMLSQRAALFANALIIAPVEERPDLRLELAELANELEASHEDLIYGNESLGIPVLDSANLSNIYFDEPNELDNKIRIYLNHLKLMEIAPNEVLVPDNPDIYTIDHVGANELLPLFDMITNQYQLELEQDIKFLHNLGYVMLVSLLFSLAGVGYFIFRPMLRNVKDKSLHLEKSEHSLRAIIDNTADGILTIDNKGLVQSYNKACEHIFGYEPNEVLGQNIKMLMPKPYHEEHDGYLENYHQSGEKKVIGKGRGVQGRHKNGSIFPAQLSVSEVIIAGETLYTGIIRDVSKEQAAIVNMESAIEKLIESNEELEKFAYVASHDLQEPLRMIRNFTQLLGKRLEGTLDDETNEYLEIACSSAERMQDLVEDLLEYARIHEEGAELELVNFDILIEYIRENLSERIFDTSTELTQEPLPTIRSNPVRILRVLQNLIGNSIKYQASNAIPKIHVSVEEIQDYWQFSVKDNGIGMKEEYCEKIFLPFQRLHHKDEYSGTGIGLAICRKIIDKMGGRIWVESELGKGSNFFFTIPINKKVSVKH